MTKTDLWQRGIILWRWIQELLVNVFSPYGLFFFFLRTTGWGFGKANKWLKQACRIPEPSKHFLDSAVLMYFLFLVLFFSNEISFLVPSLSKNYDFSMASAFNRSPFLKIISKAFFSDRQTVLFLIPLTWRRRSEDPREWRVKNLFISGCRVGHSILFFAPVLVHKYLCRRMFAVLWWREAVQKEVVLALWLR